MKVASNIEITEDKKIKLRNSFVSSSFRYSQIELDIIFLLLTIYRPDEDTYSFPLARLTNITVRSYRPEALIREAQALMSRTYSIMERRVETGNPEDDLSWVCYNLFSRIAYRRGVITATLTEDAMLLFGQTRSNYTYLQLTSALRLHGKYAKRLYMLLSQWVNVGRKTYSVDELRSFLIPGDNGDGDDAQYKAPYDFCLMVKKAVGCINEQTELKVGVVEHRQVRTVVMLEFCIEKKDRRMLLSDGNLIDFQSSPERNEFNGLCRFRGFTEEQISEMWGKGCRVEQFNRIMAKVNSTAIESGDVHDPNAYVRACFTEAGYLSKKKSRKEEEKDSERRKYLEERKRIMAVIRKSVSEGADISAFRVFLDRYGIREEEVGE